MNKIEFYERLNHLSENKIPHFFVIDFLEENFILKTLEELSNHEDIKIEFPNFKTISNQKSTKKEVVLKPKMIEFEVFKSQFLKIHHQITIGNSYLTNLTFEIPLENSESLEILFLNSKAKYKILVNEHFLCFSPESFIKINQNTISTFPMKGTIDASIPNAENLVLSNEKETAEHYTIVDLLRNDLSQVAKNVEVKRFRYVEKVKSNNKEILQVSSEIQGEIKTEFKNKIGTILSKMLPAGSISGAPKKKTIEIIRQTETHNRDFYTGIAGVFDGENLDSCVLIRFIEQKNEKLFYKSGAGIHLKSNLEEEYQEIINKIYVPVF